MTAKSDHAAYARAAGIPKVVQVFNGLFQSFFFFGFFGHDFKNGKAKFAGDGNQLVTVTDLGDIGKSVASIAYRPLAEIPDYLRVQGTVISLNDSAKLYEKLSGQKLEVEYTGTLTALSGVGSLDPLVQLAVLSEHPETSAFTFPEDENKLVNPGLWQWKTLEDAIKETVATAK